MADQPVALGGGERGADGVDAVGDRGVGVAAAVLLGGVGEPADEVGEVQRRYVGEPQPLAEEGMRAGLEMASVLDAGALAEAVAAVALVGLDPVGEVRAK